MKIGSLVLIKRASLIKSFGRGIVTELADTGSHRQYATVRLYDGTTWHGATVLLEVVSESR